MAFFYDGIDPEYDQQLVLQQGLTAILNVRDLCLLMRHTRTSAQSVIGGGYEYNQLQLEIWFLEKIIKYLGKVLLEKFDQKDKEFYSVAMTAELGLKDFGLGNYFDQAGIFHIRYEVILS